MKITRSSDQTPSS